MRNLLAIAIAGGLALAGCEREAGEQAGSEEKIALEYQEVIGRLKLVREEYGAAVRDGVIIDPVEYEEAEMFAEQAALRYRGVREHARAKDGAAHETIEKNLTELMKLIAEKRPVDEANRVVETALAQVARVNPREVPPAVEGTRDAVARADVLIAGEKEVGGYRIGILEGSAQPIFERQTDGSLVERAPSTPADRYLAVVLREIRTKRSLPAATVTLRVGDGAPVRLAHVWGEFLQYGANLPLPEGKFPIEVQVSPPAYCRHGDMLASFVAPVTARFTAERRENRLVVDGPKPSSVAEDYAIGDDVLQAIGEAKWKGEAGPYSLGFIAEAPEPIWVWTEGKPVLDAVRENDTHHLEIALMEKGSMRMVPEARVTLTLEPEEPAGGKAIEVPLLPLMSVFYHYGNTVEVPEGRYRVTVRADPPSFGALAAGAFDQRAETSFVWENRKHVAEAGTTGAGG